MDWLLGAIPNWPAETWFSFVLLIVVGFQAYITYKLWRPGGVLFCRLSLEERKRAASTMTVLEAANLSPTGMFITEAILQATSEFGNETIVDRVNLGIILPPFGSKATEFDGPLYRALQRAWGDTASASDIYSGTVTLRLQARVHKHSMVTASVTYWAEVGPGGTHKLRPEKDDTPTRSLAARVRRLLSRSE